MKTGAATMENSMKIPQKIQNLPYDNSNFTSQYLSKEMKMLTQKCIQLQRVLQ